jgi:hypothetical protein
MLNSHLVACKDWTNMLTSRANPLLKNLIMKLIRCFIESKISNRYIIYLKTNLKSKRRISQSKRVWMKLFKSQETIL